MFIFYLQQKKRKKLYFVRKKKYFVRKSAGFVLICEKTERG